MNKLFVAILGCAIGISCIGGGSSTDTIGRVRVPYHIAAEGYPAHVHLKWADNVGSTYNIYRSDESGKFKAYAQVSGNEYMDFSIGKSEESRNGSPAKVCV